MRLPTSPSWERALKLIVRIVEAIADILRSLADLWRN